MDRVGSSKLFLQLATYQFLLAIHVVAKKKKKITNVKTLKPFYLLWVTSTVTHISSTSRLQNCNMNFIAIPFGIIKMLHLLIFLTKKEHCTQIPLPALSPIFFQKCIWVHSPKTSAGIRSWYFKIASLPLGLCGSWSQCRCQRLYFLSWMQEIWGTQDLLGNWSSILCSFSILYRKFLSTFD